MPKHHSDLEVQPLGEASPSHFLHEVTRLYWANYLALLKRQDNHVPPKSAFDPTEVPSCLPYMAILDFKDPQAPVFRLSGTKFCEMMGMDTTGRLYLDFVPESRKQIALKAYGRCLDTPCGMLTNIISVDTRGREFFCEVLNLPFSYKSDEHRPRYLAATCIPIRDAGWGVEEIRFAHYTEVTKRVYMDVGFGCPAA